MQVLNKDLLSQFQLNYLNNVSNLRLYRQKIHATWELKAVYSWDNTFNPLFAKFILKF